MGRPRQKLLPQAPVAPEDDRGPIRASAAGPLLQTLHIMNRDGTISHDMRRKFKQVNHLVEIFRPTLEEIARRRGRISIVEAGCGNSYLGFLLRHHAVSELGCEVAVHGIDRNAGAVATCRARAEALGWTGMRFEVGAVLDAQLPEDADLLVALHACDTGSDEALLRGVRAGIPWIAVAPCCPREVREMIDPRGAFGAFLVDGIVAADFAATLTDVLRALWLRKHGWRAEVIEFVPLEHSIKNRLIRAKHTGRQDPAAADELAALRRGLCRIPLLFRARAGEDPDDPGSEAPRRLGFPDQAT